MPTTLILPRLIADQLIALALANPQVEVCGLLGGDENVMRHFYPVANSATDPARHFLLDARGQIAAMRTMRECGEQLRGVFHSHPISAARPSATDRAAAAYPDVYYLITSLTRRQPETAAFYYDGRDFHATSIISADAVGS
ncbi:proteasome lid subunit RPN8/RPN11 [Methylohalomonas lacus]|uniref:Proteasome lid subunit RPN8/RPN11 n=1 Tax=Methylohalomonas lacus TaxID=398773 RepID=A0AAE3HJK5_9GAMM|nr:M67 family metallopeptidase [Methylohalomonas lacus]MCS3902077.1 proteasome lid subunit RPN8/RPN11 [Methylohalomonas lacus]